MPASASRRRPRRAPRRRVTGTLTRCRGRDGRARAPRELGDDQLDLVQARRVGGADAQRLAADDALEPVGRVVGDHAAVVDDRDLVGQRVGLLQVLRGQQHGRAVGDQAAHDAPHVLALGGVEAGRRLVEEDDRRAGRRGSRRGPGGGACRRSRCARGGRRRRRGRTSRAARCARACASRRLRSSSAPISSRFWRPVSSSSTDAYWPVRPICSRTRAGSCATSWPATKALPSSASSSVARMRTAVVLPAPLGPSTPCTVPGRTARSTPSSAWVFPKRLRRPRASIA